MFKAMITLMFFLVVPILAAGQTADTTTQAKSLINIGDEVRVRLVGEPETWISGDVTGYDFTTLDLAIGEQPLSLSMDQVAEIHSKKRVGSKSGTGAGIGAIFGGVGGLAFGLALASDDFFDVGTGEILAGTLAGAAGGALLGALIGAAIPDNDWVPVDMVRTGLAPDGSQAVSLSFSF